jgi:hypothetical protein
MQFARVKVVGILNGSDVLVMIAFLYLTFSSKLKISSPHAKRFLKLCSLWFVSQCITDVVRRTAFEDMARGLSNIGITLAAFMVIFTLLYQDGRRLLIYGWGIVIGTLLTYFINPDPFALDDPWKFGFSLPVTLALVLLASSARGRGEWAPMLVIATGLMNIVLGARSMGAFCIISAIYAAMRKILLRRAAVGKKFSAGAMFFSGAMLISMIICIGWLYQQAASTGMLGNDAREKYEAQASGRYGLLLGGRTEMLGYLPAIYDSPILGHGSWAKDPKYFILQHETLAILGYKNADAMSIESIQAGLIPTHSYLFGAWVDAGILGAVVWIWAFGFSARTLFRLKPSITIPSLLVSFCGFQLLWSILFSPFGAEVRVIASYYLVVLMSCETKTYAKPLERAKRLKSPPARPARVNREIALKPIP